MGRLKRLSLLVAFALVSATFGLWLFDRLVPPSGERLVFSYKGRICIMEANGWHRRCLTEGASPAWSPEGERIAFESPRPTSRGYDLNAISLLNIDDSSLTWLTDNTGYDRGAAWSPGGNWIAFSSNREGGFEIFIIDIEDDNVVRLTHTTEENYEPAWSPDGKQIAFMARASADKSLDIYVMNADGGYVRRLTDHPADDVRPDWSPDGKRIAFESERDDNWEIYVMEADGSSQTRLTDHPNVDRGPVWSPDGTKIAFLSGRSGRTGRLIYEGITIQLQDIYVMHADGTHVKRLTYSLFGTYQDLDWSAQ